MHRDQSDAHRLRVMQLRGTKENSWLVVQWFDERCRCHGRRRRSTRVSPTTLFSCRHADALSLESYPQMRLYTIIQTSFWVSFLVPNLASSRTYVRHGPLLPPHRSSRLLHILAMDCDHTSASSWCLSLAQGTTAVSVESGCPDP